MSKINLTFKGKKYEIDKSLLSGAIASLEGTLESLSGSAEERLEGDGQEFYTMAPSTLSFRSTAPLNELQDVQINGQTVDPSNYTLEEGSTIVKLKHEYLSTLDVGSYELSVISDSKTVKGDFTVAAPELNEYGFYYNQPYYCNAIVGDPNIPWGGSFELCCAYIFYENGVVATLDLNNIQSYYTEFRREADSYIFTDEGNAVNFTGKFSSDGKSFIADAALEQPSGELSITTGINIVLDPDIVAGDQDYWYIRNSDGTYTGMLTDATKLKYPPMKSYIKDKAVVGMYFMSFGDRENLESIIIPDIVTKIAPYAFTFCEKLAVVTFPSTILSIGAFAFTRCVALYNIIFDGTVAQWNSITKEPNWDYDLPATYVQCSDGQVVL